MLVLVLLLYWSKQLSCPVAENRALHHKNLNLLNVFLASYHLGLTHQEPSLAQRVTVFIAFIVILVS